MFQNRSCFKVRTLFCSECQTGKFPKVLQTVMQTVLLGRHSPSHLTSLLVRILYRTPPGDHMGQAEGISIPQQAPWLVPHLGGVHGSLPTVPEGNTLKRKGKEEGTTFPHPSAWMGVSPHLRSLQGQIKRTGLKWWSR